MMADFRRIYWTQYLLGLGMLAVFAIPAGWWLWNYSGADPYILETFLKKFRISTYWRGFGGPVPFFRQYVWILPMIFTALAALYTTVFACTAALRRPFGIVAGIGLAPAALAVMFPAAAWCLIPASEMADGMVWSPARLTLWLALCTGLFAWVGERYCILNARGGRMIPPTLKMCAVLVGIGAVGYVFWPGVAAIEYLVALGRAERTPGLEIPSGPAQTAEGRILHEHRAGLVKKLQAAARARDFSELKQVSELLARLPPVWVPTRLYVFRCHDRRRYFGPVEQKSIGNLNRIEYPLTELMEALPISADTLPFLAWLEQRLSIPRSELLRTRVLTMPNRNPNGEIPLRDEIPEADLPPFARAASAFRRCWPSGFFRDFRIRRTTAALNLLRENHRRYAGCVRGGTDREKIAALFPKNFSWDFASGAAPAAALRLRKFQTVPRIQLRRFAIRHGSLPRNPASAVRMPPLDLPLWMFLRSASTSRKIPRGGRFVWCYRMPDGVFWHGVADLNEPEAKQ